MKLAIERIKTLGHSNIENTVALALDRLLLNVSQYRGARILIKPNLTSKNVAACTDPYVVTAIAHWLLSKGAQVTVGDASAIGIDTEEVIKALGLKDLLRPLGVQVVDLRKAGFKKIDARHYPALRTIELSKVALDSDFIFNIAKLKTSNAATVSLTIKNLKGLVSDIDRLRFHKLGVQYCLADVLDVIDPEVSIIEGIHGWDIDESVKVGTILVGTDPLATDWVGSVLMGIEPKGVAHLTFIKKCGLGHIPPESAIRLAKQHAKQFSGPVRSVQDCSLPKNINIQFAGDCYGCLSVLNTVLKQIEMDGSLADTFGKTRYLDFLVGMHANIPETFRSSLIAVGTCAVASLCSATGKTIEGCPPHSSTVLRPKIQEFIRNG